MGNVAAEVVYHLFCQLEFTNKYILEHLNHILVEKESPYTAAFKVLFVQVEHVLLEFELVMTLPALRD